MATRAAASRAASALARRVRLIRLAPDSIKPPCTVAVMDRPPPVLASSPLFSLHMRPLRAPPEAARPGLPPLVGPAWLPRPPQRATHAPRHLDRWRGAADGETPFYVIVLAGKKRVHKLAVIRNRCRARLVAALRAVVQHERLPILPHMVYVFFAAPGLYSASIEDISLELRRVLHFVARKRDGGARAPPAPARP